MKELLIAIPTYNEAANIEALVDRVRRLGLGADIVIIDDNSPDRTGEIADRMAAKHADVVVIHRPGKLGVGTAHLDGIRYAYKVGYRVLVTMDADFSHTPEDIPQFLTKTSAYDVVVGTRFERASSLQEWNKFRKAMTTVGHCLTKSLLRLPYDATGALRAYRLDRIQADYFDLITSRDYAFFFESLAMPSFGGARYQLWSNLLTWIPYPDVHDNRLKFDPWNAGLDHRYIGLATLPLILTALVVRLHKMFVGAALLTILVCNGLLIYTFDNLAFAGLMENFTFFQNVRTMPGLLPRDGPSLLMILIAAVGFDAILHRPVPPDGAAAAGLARFRVSMGRSRMLMTLLEILIGISAIAIISLFNRDLRDIRDRLGHVGVYLGLFTLICTVLWTSKSQRSKRVVSVIFLVLVLADLTQSASAYWARQIIWTPGSGPSAVPQHRLPTAPFIGPITNEVQSWAGTASGVFHNTFMPPFYGKREWLVFALDRRLVPMLKNWNPSTRRVTAYPYFEFFSGGTYVPFERVRDIDSVPSLVPPDYGRIVSEGGLETLVINGRQYPVRPGLAGYVEHADNGREAAVFMGWAIDEEALAPAQAVALFVGDRLWIRGASTEPRADVAAMHPAYLHSGFKIEANRSGHFVPPGDRVGVRAYAILRGGTARELRYSLGYPFASKASVGPAYLAKPADHGTPRPPVYVHDETLARSGSGTAEAMKSHWVVTAFTLNRVQVNVSMPRDGLMVAYDNYHPYWRARVNGIEVPIYRANFTFKAVRVPAGTHEVEWVFDPYPVKWAWVAFYVTLSVFVVVIWRFLLVQR